VGCLASVLEEHVALGRAIAQAVSRWLPTVAAWVQAQVKSCGICGGWSGTGAGFLWVLQFPLPIFIPPIAPQSPSSVIRGWYNRTVVAAVPSGLSLTPLRIIIILEGHAAFILRVKVFVWGRYSHIYSHRDRMLVTQSHRKRRGGRDLSGPVKTVSMELWQTALLGAMAEGKVRIVINCSLWEFHFREWCEKIAVQKMGAGEIERREWCIHSYLMYSNRSRYRARNKFTHQWI
jgi:hypothetical protein